MSKRLRARLYRLPYSQLARVISTVAACNSLPDRQDERGFIKSQAPEYTALIEGIRRVERNSPESLAREYQRIAGHNGMPPKEGYFLAIIKHTLGLRTINQIT